MAIQAVSFDAAGTLIKTAKPVGESYATIAQRYGMRVTPAELSARFRTCFERSPPLAFPGAPTVGICELERDWWQQLVREVFSPFGRFENFAAYFDELFAYFSRAESWELYPEAGDALQALDRRGLKLIVVSNFDSRLFGILEGLGVASSFADIFVSSAVGYAKPDRRIFDFVLGALQLAPEHVVHVGDSLTNDLGGAANAGMKGILVDRKGAQQSASMAQVASLQQILDYLD